MNSFIEQSKIFTSRLLPVFVSFMVVGIPATAYAQNFNLGGAGSITSALPSAGINAGGCSINLLGGALGSIKDAVSSLDIFGSSGSNINDLSIDNANESLGDLSGLVGGSGSGSGSIGGFGNNVPVDTVTGNPILRQIYTTNKKNTDIQQSNQTRDDVLSCLTRAIARSLLENMTSNVVNWINSGFKGSPSFVTNYNQFFLNVADQAAGEFIQGSDLAFLCSPFKLQVKIAVAQAYAHRRTPAQCTLSQATNNIEAFMNNFSQGGWQAFMSFTTVPTNNPFGAFLYAQGGLYGAVNSAQSQRQQELLQGNGYLTFQQEKNCRNVPAQDAPSGGLNRSVTAIGDGSLVRVCDLVSVTPGSAINQALGAQFGGDVQSLVNAKYFDEIISALVSQLIQQTLYGGLFNLSSNGGYQNYYTPASSGSSATGSLSNSLLRTIEGYIQNQQQVITILKQDIVRIEQTLTHLHGVETCGSTSQVPDIASTTSASIARLALLRTQYNATLTQATSTLNDLNQFHAAAQNANSSNIQTISQSFVSYSATYPVATPTDVVNAGQDQILLFNNLDTLDTYAVSAQSQCNATS